VSFTAELALVALHRHVDNWNRVAFVVLIVLDVKRLLAVVALHVAYII
jgi:hypothetical protein